MLKFLILILLFLTATQLQSAEYDICEGVVIDDVTGMAYGQHGMPYTDEIACYWDKEKSLLKSKRAYESGRPIGRHICYEQNGVPAYSISYDHTKTKKRSSNYTTINAEMNRRLGPYPCVEGIDGACWNDKPCKPDDNRCKFKCK